MELLVMKMGSCCQLGMAIMQQDMELNVYSLTKHIIKSKMGAKHNKPILLAYPNQEGILPDSLSQILLILANQQTFSVFIDTTLKGKQIKELIYTKVSKTLAPKDMILQLNQKRIADQEQIQQTLTLKDVIVQKKIPINEISKIEVYSKIQDQISLEQGVVKMPCGHMIGRTSIISLLQTVAAEKKWEIYCPFQNCHQEWDYPICRKIATFTQEEDKYFTNQFSKNWLQNHTKICPGCGHAIIRETQHRSKVKCSNSSCKFGYFCFKCFKPWKTNNFIDCGNEQCSFKKNQWLLHQMKQIQLLNKDNGIQIVIQVPTMRLCPSCGLLIEHNQGCKHMRCYNCNKEFCWVCLAVLKRSWPCGSYGEYCGSVAPVQQVKR